MGRRKAKAEAEAAEAAAAEQATETDGDKKRGFFGKLVRGGIFMGAVAAAVRYFGDPAQGSSRREKVKGQVKDLVDKQKAVVENKTSSSS